MKSVSGIKRSAIIKWLNSFLCNPKNGEKLFLSVFLVHVVFLCLRTTMFQFPNIVFTVEKCVALFLVLLKIVVFDKYSYKQLLFGIVFLIDAVLVAGFSTYQQVLLFVIIVLGSKDVDFENILRVYVVATITVLLAAFIASRLNIIEDLVYIRQYVDYVEERNSFGVGYPTDFAAHVFFLLSAFYYLFRNSLKAVHFLAGILVSVMVYIFCIARLDSATMLILIVAIGMIELNKNQYIHLKNTNLAKNKQVITDVISLIPIVAFLFVYFMSAFFRPNIIFFRIFNELLSDRLRLGNKALQDYGLTLFGQSVPMNGNGSSLFGWGDYFYIDSSYLLAFLCYGVIFLLMVFLIHYWCCKKYSEDIYYLVIITVIVVNCVVAHHMIDIAYNPFYLALLASRNKQVV